MWGGKPIDSERAENNCAGNERQVAEAAIFGMAYELGNTADGSKQDRHDSDEMTKYEHHRDDRAVWLSVRHDARIG